MSPEFPQRILVTARPHHDTVRDDLWLNAGLKLQELARRHELLANLIAAGVERIIDGLLTADNQSESRSSGDGGLS
jgi:hypothetical protein